jgi:thymidine phosphorylase
MDKNSHNLAAAKQEGRTELAREIEMLIDGMTNSEYPDEEILDAVQAKVINELA